MIGDDGAGRLAGRLAQCRALAHLNLSYNHIESDGAESLAGVLAQCKALAHLDLRSSNEIGSGGARRLAEVQAKRPALVHLYLNDIRLQDHEAGKLAGVLAQAERWIASVYFPDSGNDRYK